MHGALAAAAIPENPRAAKPAGAVRPTEGVRQEGTSRRRSVRRTSTGGNGPGGGRPTLERTGGGTDCRTELNEEETPQLILVAISRESQSRGGEAGRAWQQLTGSEDDADH
jgi:hypothetical protein